MLVARGKAWPCRARESWHLLESSFSQEIKFGFVFLLQLISKDAGVHPVSHSCVLWQVTQPALPTSSISETRAVLYISPAEEKQNDLRKTKKEYLREEKIQQNKKQTMQGFPELKKLLKVNEQIVMNE